MKIKLFEEFTNEDKQVASSGTITMYNLDITAIEELLMLGADVKKDKELSTDKDSVFTVKFVTKEVGQKIFNWVKDNEEGIPQGDLENLYPDLFEAESTPPINVGDKDPVTLSVMFGKDQTQNVINVLDKLRTQKHVIGYKHENKGKDMIGFVIEFSSVFGVYVFGREQGNINQLNNF